MFWAANSCTHCQIALDKYTYFIENVFDFELDFVCFYIDNRFSQIIGGVIAQLQFQKQEKKIVFLWINKKPSTAPTKTIEILPVSTLPIDLWP